MIQKGQPWSTEGVCMWERRQNRFQRYQNGNFVISRKKPDKCATKL